MADCNSCKHKMCWEYAEPCSSCTDMDGEPTNWKPQTNADRIRAMTDEGLATKLYLFACVHVFDSRVKCKDSGCKKCWLNWLNEEVKDV